MDLQASSSLGSRTEAQDRQAPNQALEVLDKEQEVLTKRLVDLQRTEAVHLQTISEVCVLRTCLDHLYSTAANWS